MKKCLFVFLSLTLISSLPFLNAASASEEETEYQIVGHYAVQTTATIAPPQMVVHGEMRAEVPSYTITTQYTAVTPMAAEVPVMTIRGADSEEGDGVAEDPTEAGHAPGGPGLRFEPREPGPATPVGTGSLPTIRREGFVPAATGRVLDRDGENSAEVATVADATALNEQGFDDGTALEVRGNSLIGGCSLQAPTLHANFFHIAAFLVVFTAPVVLRKKLFASH